MANELTGPPRRLDAGRIVAQVRLDGPAGEIGDALAILTPDSPEWAVWDAWLPRENLPSDGGRKTVPPNS